MNIEKTIRATKDHLNTLESRLNGLLRPIQPRSEFVTSVRHRLQVTQRPAIIDRFTNLQFVFISLLGVISGVVLVVMGARFLVNMLGVGKSNRIPN